MEKLTPRSFQIIDLVVQGVKSGQIAKRLSLSHAYVSQIMSAPQFQHQLAMRREKVQDRMDGQIVDSTIEASNKLKKHAIDAANKMVELLDNGSANLQKSAAAEILDRTGVKTDDKAQVAAAVIVIDDKSAAVIKQALLTDQK